jgi:endo-beta-N-acetylglucosaminidase D
MNTHKPLPDQQEQVTQGVSEYEQWEAELLEWERENPDDDEEEF